ncbi:hypothetical protein PANDA_019505 [Ailuropoda melanoleuca]|uniref:Superoxide dismutase copper/zinc binding domain-containing protein n=1 Tax=Ailuropoda melanoleuca TaxID=9646 RepID=D2I2A5_AILME|nr:hypothetical protein PANDA_019505 [Ailuropoda melanoleuca]
MLAPALLCVYVLLVAPASRAGPGPSPEEPGSSTEAQIRDMHAKPRVSGLVLFRQLAPGARLEAFFDLEGFPAEANSSSRAIHVHQFGDLSQGCESTGAHYNPLAEP